MSKKKKQDNDFDKKQEMSKALKLLSARWKVPVIVAEKNKKKRGDDLVSTG